MFNYFKKNKINLSKLSVEQFIEELKFSEVNKHIQQMKEELQHLHNKQDMLSFIVNQVLIHQKKASNKLSYCLVRFVSLEASKLMQYQIYDFSIGHGFYALHNSGVIYHNDDPPINITKVKSLIFDKSDSIICYYDAQQQQFTFFKESNKNDKYIMKLNDPSRRLFQVAIVFGPGDSISVI